MKTWEKVLAAVASLILIGGATLGVMIYRHVKYTIPDLYAQWATAEMVIAFREDNKRMPATWDELAPHYGSDAPHNGGLSFIEIKERIIIEFPNLPKLELKYSSHNVPEVIYTVSGVQSSWGGAEPNELVNHIILNKK